MFTNLANELGHHLAYLPVALKSLKSGPTLGIPHLDSAALSHLSKTGWNSKNDACLHVFQI